MIKFNKKDGVCPLILAPMAGFSDRAMRLVCRKYGADFSVSEMVSAKAVCFNDKKTASLARVSPDEGPVAVQIFGSEPDIMARAAQTLSLPIDGGCAPVGIDINMGCPVHKVFSNGEGSALMRDPEQIWRIVKAVKGATELPVSVKLRKGIDSTHVNAVECALAAENAGAAFITVHGRTRVEMYSGKCDYSIIANVKKALQIPVVVSGDITDAASAEFAIKATGADALMIGRGAIGNPFVFAEIKAALGGAKYTSPDLRERVDAALLQLSLSVSDKGEEIAVREARKQVALYLKGFRGAAAVRYSVNRATTFDEVRDALYTALEKEEL